MEHIFMAIIAADEHITKAIKADAGKRV